MSGSHDAPPVDYNQDWNRGELNRPFAEAPADEPPSYTLFPTSTERWHTERYAVLPCIMKDITIRLGEPMPQIDAFADSGNFRLPRWWGPDSPECTDAFSTSWAVEDCGTLWANPPFSKIDQVIEKAQKEGARIILILPDWPSQQWFGEVWKHAQRYHYYPETTPLFELDSLPMPPTLKWGVWAIL